MADNELTLVWQQLDSLHQAIAGVVRLQRATLEALAPRAVHSQTPGQPPDAMSEIYAQLDDLCERLEHGRQAVEQQVARLSGAEGLRVTEFTAERVNIVEPDGTLRLVISNTERFPDPVLNGKSLGKRDGGSAAGIIFYNEEGDECGGLVFGGKRAGDEYTAGGSLTFDQYHQDQVIGFQHDDANGQRSAALRVWDRPDMPLDEWIERINPIFELPDGPEKQAAIQQLLESGLLAAQRVFVGRDRNRDAAVCLFDAQGRLRLRLAVDAAGAPVLQFFDEAGEVIAAYPGPDADHQAPG